MMGPWPRLPPSATPGAWCVGLARTGSSCPAGGTGARMWSSTACHAAQQAAVGSGPGPPAQRPRGAWQRSRRERSRRPPPLPFRKALTVGVGLDTWPSDMLAVDGGVGSLTQSRKGCGRPKRQRRRAGQRARERGGGGGSKCKHDRRDCRQQSFERAGLRHSSRPKKAGARRARRQDQCWQPSAERRAVPMAFGALVPVAAVPDDHPPQAPADPQHVEVAEVAVVRAVRRGARVCAPAGHPS